jgi:hypothetical protein
LKNGNGHGVKNPIPNDPNFEQGFPKYNPQTFDWEYASFYFMNLNFPFLIS